MDMSLRERVAAAIWTADERHEGTPWDVANPKQQDRLRMCADAVLAEIAGQSTPGRRKRLLINVLDDLSMALEDAGVRPERVQVILARADWELWKARVTDELGHPPFQGPTGEDGSEEIRARGVRYRCAGDPPMALTTGEPRLVPEPESEPPGREPLPDEAAAASGDQPGSGQGEVSST
jgi:hypothetical protein